jgi:hypothetical protein
MGADWREKSNLEKDEIKVQQILDKFRFAVESFLMMMLLLCSFLFFSYFLFLIC